MLVTTIELLPGYRVHRILGEVIGITTRSDDPYSEGLKSANDGVRNPLPHRALLTTRAEAVAAMVEHARHLGANAVVGMRFDHRVIAASWSEICAYGTALLVAPADAPRGWGRRNRKGEPVRVEAGRTEQLRAHPEQARSATP